MKMAEPIAQYCQLITSRTGGYQLAFAAGDYLRRQGHDDDILFLDEVIVRFGINNADQHYHVPLLLSPYGYSTYRGS